MSEELENDPLPDSDEIESEVSDETEIESDLEMMDSPESDEVESSNEESIESDDEPESPSKEKYDPDFTYRVLDDEYEMDDRIKKYIKSPEDEELFRDLLSRADGIDGVRQDRQVLRDDNFRLMETENTRQQAVQQLQNFVQKGDLKPFMDTWGIDDNKLAQYMQQRIQLMELPPEQRAAFEANEQARLESMTLQQQYSQLQQQNYQLQVNQLSSAVDQTLSRPEISEHVRNYDSQKGPGAFRREIAALGDYYYKQGRGVVPPEQLSKEVINKWYSQPITPDHAAQNHRGAESRRQKVVVMDKNKPTLPRVVGSGASPVKTAPRSISDLRKISAERYGV